MRLFLDANVFISYLLVKKEDSPIIKIVEAGLEKEFDLLMTEDLLEEFVVKCRKKTYLSNKVTVEEIEELVDIISESAELLQTIKQNIPIVCRDPKDNYLLAHALAGEADYLVTGDADVLVLKQIDDLKIVTPREFLEILISV